MKLFEKTVIVAVCGSLVFSVAAAALQEQATKQEQMREVRQKLSGVRPPETEFDFVTFDLSRTTVILRGFTVGEERKQNCGKAVQEIPWVGHVLNYVEALSDGYNDEKLRSRIRFIMRQRVPILFSDNRARIRIKVNSGSVTLIGAVPEDEEEALKRAIGEIKVEDLVRSVENKTVLRK